VPTYAEQFVADIEAVKNAIAVIIEGVVPKAKVLRRFVYDPNHTTWTAMLTSDNDLDSTGKPRVNCIQVWYDGISIRGNEVPQPLKMVNPVLPFGIGFYQGPFNLGNDEDNGEKRMMVDIATVGWELENKSDLAIRALVSHHRGFEIPRLRPLKLSVPVMSGASRFEVVMQTRNVRSGPITP
jgi:hypothetical protein